MAFDFDTAVSAPFRMQPGLRRITPGTLQLTPLAPGSRHLREKLAVLSAFWPQALCAVPGFDTTPALHTLYQHAVQEQPQAWAFDGSRVQALQLGTAVQADGSVEQIATGLLGVGDEVARCLQNLPATWRQAGLACLAFAEDFAIIDGRSGTIPWLAVALPSHWAPEDKLGRHFTDVHGPVADNTTLLKATEGLIKLATGTDRWERFVWTISDHPRLHAHPARSGGRRWHHTRADQAWWRTEHQTFIPVAASALNAGAATGAAQAVFTIHVDVQPLADAVNTPARSALLHAALASMSPAVLDYRGLSAVREPLLAWLHARAQAQAA